MRLMPANAAYPAQLADELYASDPSEAKSLLQRAVKLNRYDAASWIQLGLLSEAGNDLPQAEKSLLQAAGVDSTFLPSWSLANFYFRQQNAARFWYWAQKAAQMVPDDATPLFRLAWYVNPNAQEIENRLQMKRPAVEGQFVNFLLTQGDPEAVTEAASHLLQTSNQESTETLLGACDWLLAHKRPDLALGAVEWLGDTDILPPAGSGLPRDQRRLWEIAPVPRLRLASPDGGRGELLSEREPKRPGLRIFRGGAGQFSAPRARPLRCTRRKTMP